MLGSNNCCIPACEVLCIWNYFPDISKEVKLGLFSWESISSLQVNISKSVGKKRVKLHLCYREQVNCVTASAEFISRITRQSRRLICRDLCSSAPSPPSCKTAALAEDPSARRGPIYLQLFWSLTFWFPTKTVVIFYTCNLAEQGNLPVSGFFHWLLCIMGILVWPLSCQICHRQSRVAFQGPVLWRCITVDCDHCSNFRIQTAARGKIVMIQMLLFFFSTKKCTGVVLRANIKKRKISPKI